MTIAPLVSALATAGPVLAVERRQSDVRDTKRHAHPQGQLIGSLTGLLSLTTPEGSWVVPATHAIWVPPHLPHALRSHGPFAGFSVYVAENACAVLPATARTLRVSGLLREAVHRAAAWKRAPKTDAEQRIAGVILDEIARLPDEALGLPRPRDPRAKRVAEGVLADLANGDPLETWAAGAGISARTLARRFTDETGFGFSAWRQRARALRAIALLAEGTPVTTIAIDLGYDNVSAFIAMFQRVTGTTPGKYLRAQNA